jgi:hypothetical protein
MTTALGAAASAMHPTPLSLSTIPSQYYQWHNGNGGPYDLANLPTTDMAQLNIQDYTDNQGWFDSNVSLMYNNVPAADLYKIQIAMQDGPSGSSNNAAIAGYCLQMILGNRTQSVAVWPNGGGELQFPDTYGYYDPYSTATNNWAFESDGGTAWFYYYLGNVGSVG